MALPGKRNLPAACGGSGGGNGCSGTSCGESRQSKSKAPEEIGGDADGAENYHPSGG